MKKLVFLVTAVFITTMVFAQTDFSGSWTLNTSKSKLSERSFAPKSAVIVQTKTDMSIETRSEFNGRNVFVKASTLWMVKSAQTKVSGTWI